MMRLKRALSEFVVEGIETTIPLFQQLLAEPDIIDGRYDIHWLEHYLSRDRRDDDDHATDPVARLCGGDFPDGREC